MKIWLALVSDAVRHRRHWSALWRARSAIRTFDAAFAGLDRRQVIPWPYGKIDSE